MATEPSWVILGQTKKFKKLKSDTTTVPKQAKTKWDGVTPPPKKKTKTKKKTPQKKTKNKNKNRHKNKLTILTTENFDTQQML